MVCLGWMCGGEVEGVMFLAENFKRRFPITKETHEPPGVPPPRVVLIDHSSYRAVAAHPVDVPQGDL